MALDDDLKSAAYGSSTPKILKIRVNRQIVHFNSTNDNKNPELLFYSSTSSEPPIIHRK
jgi:hypothetical protein